MNPVIKSVSKVPIPITSAATACLLPEEFLSLFLTKIVSYEHVIRGAHSLPWHIHCFQTLEQDLFYTYLGLHQENMMGHVRLLL